MNGPNLEHTMDVTVVFDKEDKSMARMIRDWLIRIGGNVISGETVEGA